MQLNQSKGDMYPFVTHTWNTVKGQCPDHDCVYCLSGDTLILMGNLSQKPICDIKIGDTVIGTSKDDKGYRGLQYAEVESTNIRQTVAYSIQMTDRNLICSADHKWLLHEGIWRSLNNATHPDRRFSHLKIGSKLKVAHSCLYTKANPENDLYKRGYLSGMIFGDATLKQYSVKAQNIIRNGRNYTYSPTQVYKFRLALNDTEALFRTKKYLNYFGVKTFAHIHAGMPSIRKDGRTSFESINSLITIVDNEAFWAGFLGGIYDAEGSCDGSSFRISNKDIDIITLALDYFNFTYHIGKNKTSEVYCITLHGGFYEQLRFVDIANPAIMRKRQRLLKALKGGYSEIKSIEKIGKMDLFDLQTSTGDFIANGLISHNCYMKVFKLNKRRFDEGELKTNLGEGKFIFVGSSNDMFSKTVPIAWIQQTLSHCQKYPGNRYLFQSKNPQRFREFMTFPMNSILGTTIESNRIYDISKAPTVLERKLAMEKIPLPTIITIEPILDFDLDILVRWMNDIKPEWINIGADSKGHNLQEPPKTKIIELINELRKSHKVELKANLSRIIGLFA